MAYAITVEDATRGVFVAWRLFLRDGRVAELIDDSRQGVIKSFWSAAIALPIFGLILLLETGTESNSIANFGVLAGEAGLAAAFLASLVAYVIGWVAWPLFLHHLAPMLGCGRAYFRYLVAYNWMYAMWWLALLGYATLRLTGVVTAEMSDAFGLGLLTVLWAYHWYVMKVTLDLSGGVTAMLVATHFIVMSIVDHTGMAVAL